MPFKLNSLAPEGGDLGGEIVFEGTPEGLVACEESYTGRYLVEKLDSASRKKN